MFNDERREGPRFAFAQGAGYGPGGYEGWQPWARREAPPWPEVAHKLWHFARRFPFGPEMRPGGPRMFGRGDLKYALLDLLKERPKHGYEMIKELEERAGGFYTPSAGSVYPTLQLLEDRDWVSSETQGGKKVYTITDAGRKELEEQRQRQEQWRSARGEHHHGHHHEGPFGGRGPRPELHALRREAMEVAGLMRTAVMSSGGDPARLEKVRAIVARTRSDLLALLNEQSQAEQPGSSAPGSEPPASGPPSDVL